MVRVEEEIIRVEEGMIRVEKGMIRVEEGMVYREVKSDGRDSGQDGGGVEGWRRGSYMASTRGENCARGDGGPDGYQGSGRIE
jgi:hypothetical protein